VQRVRRIAEWVEEFGPGGPESAGGADVKGGPESAP
jgi:hypothetical protein